MELSRSWSLINFAGRLNMPANAMPRQEINFTINLNPDNIEQRESLAWKIGFRNETTVRSDYHPPTVLPHLPNTTYYCYLEPEASYGESLDKYLFLKMKSLLLSMYVENITLVFL